MIYWSTGLLLIIVVYWSWARDRCTNLPPLAMLLKQSEERWGGRRCGRWWDGVETKENRIMMVLILSHDERSAKVLL